MICAAVAVSAALILSCYIITVLRSAVGLLACYGLRWVRITPADLRAVVSCGVVYARSAVFCSVGARLLGYDNETP